MKPIKCVLCLHLLVLFTFSITYAGRYYDCRVARWLTPDPQMQKYPAWSPYNYGLNNPLRNIDPNGEEVKVFTERLGLGVYSRAVPGLFSNVPYQYQSSLFLIGAGVWETVGVRHSFIQVTTDKYDKIIELGGPLPNHQEGNPISNDSKGASERPGQEEHSVQRPEGVSATDYSFENKVNEINTTMSNYIKENKLPVYGGTGPNSNGYAQFLIQAAGGKVQLPGNAFGKDDTKPYWDIYNQILKQQEEKKKQDEQQK